jgi:oligosaccharide translocation protein RFT1
MASGFFQTRIFDVFFDPIPSKKNTYFDGELLQLSGAMTAQSVVKHFLTEGDKLLVSRLSPLADQGGYAIASNYGAWLCWMVWCF